MINGCHKGHSTRHMDKRTRRCFYIVADYIVSGGVYCNERPRKTRRKAR